MFDSKKRKKDTSKKGSPQYRPDPGGHAKKGNSIMLAFRNPKNRGAVEQEKKKKKTRKPSSWTVAGVAGP